MTMQAWIDVLGEFANRGFALKQSGDHVLELLHHGQPIARFSQVGATGECLQAECALHLVVKHGWDGCIWSRNQAGNE